MRSISPLALSASSAVLIAGSRAAFSLRTAKATGEPGSSLPMVLTGKRSDLAKA